MTAQSFRGNINTAGEYETLASKTNITFTSGNYYYFYFGGQCDIKILDFEAPYYREKLSIQAGADDIYIRTGANDCYVSVLEMEQV